MLYDVDGLIETHERLVASDNVAESSIRTRDGSMNSAVRFAERRGELRDVALVVMLALLIACNAPPPQEEVETAAPATTPAPTKELPSPTAAASPPKQRNLWR